MDSTKFDKGLYNVSHNMSDFGKFKTPSLRDVALTGPWMHNGMMKNIKDVIRHYNKGADGNGSSDKLVKMLYLREKEQDDLESFIKAISASPVEFKKPVLPK